MEDKYTYVCVCVHTLLLPTWFFVFHFYKEKEILLLEENESEPLG